MHLQSRMRAQRMCIYMACYVASTKMQARCRVVQQRNILHKSKNLLSDDMDEHASEIALRHTSQVRFDLADSSVAGFSVEEPEDFASCALATRLLVIHDAIRCRHDDVTELTRRQQVGDPGLVAV